jgi:acyl carrier protein
VSSVNEALLSLLIGQFEVPESEITPDTTLADLGLDSLALAGLALELREELGVLVEQEEANKDTTVRELLETLTAKTAAA